MVHHPEITPTKEKPSWKEMLAALIGVLALAGLIAWNQADKTHNGGTVASNVQVAEHPGG